MYRIPITLTDYATERLLDYVVDDEGCWLFRGKPAALRHYPTFKVLGATVQVNRYMAILTYGQPDPIDLDACHTCDVKPCINPKHIYWGTRKRNIQDCVDRKRHASQQKTHCPAGHEYTAENTHLKRSNRGDGKRWRECRECNKLRIRRLKAEGRYNYR